MLQIQFLKLLMSGNSSYREAGVRKSQYTRNCVAKNTKYAQFRCKNHKKCASKFCTFLRPFVHFWEKWYIPLFSSNRNPSPEFIFRYPDDLRNIVQQCARHYCDNKTLFWQEIPDTFQRACCCRCRENHRTHWVKIIFKGMTMIFQQEGVWSRANIESTAWSEKDSHQPSEFLSVLYLTNENFIYATSNLASWLK